MFKKIMPNANEGGPSRDISDKEWDAKVDEAQAAAEAVLGRKLETKEEYRARLEVQAERWTLIMESTRLDIESRKAEIRRALARQNAEGETVLLDLAAYEKELMALGLREYAMNEMRMHHADNLDMSIEDTQKWLESKPFSSEHLTEGLPYAQAPKEAAAILAGRKRRESIK